MNKINIGIILDSNACNEWGYKVISAATSCNCNIAIYTNAYIDDARAITVATHNANITLLDNSVNASEDYIISMCDVVVASSDNIYYRRSAVERQIPYISNGIIYHNELMVSYNDEYIIGCIGNILSVDCSVSIDNNAAPFWAKAYAKFYAGYKKKASRSVAYIDNNKQFNDVSVLSHNRGDTTNNAVDIIDEVAMEKDEQRYIDMPSSDCRTGEIHSDVNSKRQASTVEDKTSVGLHALLSHYDKQATKYNAIYRSSLYLRALFPLLATLAVALAVNIKSFGNYMAPWSMWSIISSGLFFLQAVFNYLIIALSNYVVKRYVIEKFTNARYMAENLRMLEIICPIGLPRAANSRIVFTDTDGNTSNLNAIVTRLMREYSATEVVYNNACLTDIAAKLEYLLVDQINYHSKTAISYEYAGRSLNRWAKIFFIAGLCVVIGRGVYQSIAQLAMIDGASNGVKTADFITSIVNFFALSIPPITALFTGLSASLNLENNHARSLVMGSRLSIHLSGLNNMDKSAYRYSDINIIVASLSSLFVDETLDWHMVTRQKKVNKM